MTIIDKERMPELLAENAGRMIEQNLRYRDLLQRVVARMPGLGNTELMSEIKSALAEGA